MEYNIKDKLEWTVIFILEFGRKDRNYGYVHTQSFASMVNDIAEYCHRHGGALV